MNIFLYFHSTREKYFCLLNVHTHISLSGFYIIKDIERRDARLKESDINF